MHGYQDFERFARRTVADYVNEHLEEESPRLSPDDVFIAWYSKELQNHKATLATPLADGMYYELTWNGSRQEAYLDIYRKLENRVAKPDLEEEE